MGLATEDDAPANSIDIRPHRGHPGDASACTTLVRDPPEPYLSSVVDRGRRVLGVRLLCGNVADGPRAGVVK